MLKSIPGSIPARNNLPIEVPLIKPYKTTWDYSFKWKPSEFNTIDFLISIKKQSSGEDFIGN